MNIFYIDYSPQTAAISMYDKHVVKMILESAQLLSTAHRILDGEEYRGPSASGKTTVKRWYLADDRDEQLYHATHVNHPSAVWSRQCGQNYYWLYQHFIGLLDEYTYRYGKEHKCEYLRNTLQYTPDSIEKATFTDPPPAMPEEFIVDNDSLASYRKYYKYGKKHLFSFKRRMPPAWLEEIG